MIDKINENIKKTDSTLSKTIDYSQKKLQAAILSLENRIIREVSQLNTSPSGYLVGPRVNLKQAQEIHKQLIRLFDNEYGSASRAVVEGYSVAEKLIINNFRNLDVAAEYTSFDKDMMKLLRHQILTEFVNLGTDSRDKISNALYNHIAAQSPIDDLVNTIRGALVGHESVTGVPLSNYADLYASDGVMNYYNSVHMEKARQNNFKYFMFVGSIIETSRDFCENRAGRVFSKEEIEGWDFKWKGKRGPAFTFRGGWNCRHHWQPVRKSWVSADKFGLAGEDEVVKIKQKPMPGDVHFIEITTKEQFKEFQSNMRKVKKEHRLFLDWYTWEEYQEKGARIFMESNGYSGYAITRDNMVITLWTRADAPRGIGQKAIKDGILRGMNNLECFDPVLPKIYGKFGFKVVDRFPWNTGYAPAGWDYDKFGKPDYVIMRLDSVVRSELTPEDIVRIKKVKLEDIAQIQRELPFDTEFRKPKLVGIKHKQEYLPFEEDTFPWHNNSVTFVDEFGEEYEIPVKYVEDYIKNNPDRSAVPIHDAAQKYLDSVLNIEMDEEPGSLVYADDEETPITPIWTPRSQVDREALEAQGGGVVEEEEEEEDLLRRIIHFTKGDIVPPDATIVDEDIVKVKQITNGNVNEVWRVRMADDPSGKEWVYKPMKGESLYTSDIKYESQDMLEEIETVFGEKYASVNDLDDEHWEHLEGVNSNWDKERYLMRRTVSNQNAPLTTREIMALKVGQSMDLNNEYAIVPDYKAVLDDDGNLQGFLIEYIEQSVDASKWYDRAMTDEEVYQMSLFDFIIGNSDRHRKNWKRYEGDDIAGYGVPVYIDHGYTFPNMKRDRGAPGKNLLGTAQLRMEELADYQALDGDIDPGLREDLIRGLQVLSSHSDDIDDTMKKLGFNSEERIAFWNRVGYAYEHVENGTFSDVMREHQDDNYNWGFSSEEWRAPES